MYMNFLAFLGLKNPVLNRVNSLTSTVQLYYKPFFYTKNHFQSSYQRLDHQTMITLGLAFAHAAELEAQQSKKAKT